MRAARMSDLAEIRARLDALESAVFRVLPRPEQDGWITNGYHGDTATVKMLGEEYTEVFVGDPRPTPQRTLEQLKEAGVVGFYTHPGGDDDQ